MYERFTDRARKTMQLANQAAYKLNHEYIGTEHVLLGLIREGGGVAAAMFRQSGIDLDELQAAVLKLVQPGEEMITMGKLPQTPGCKSAISHAIKEAVKLGNNHIGTEHMLLGLLREDAGLAFQVLTQAGLTYKLAVAALNLVLVGDVTTALTPRRDTKKAIADAFEPLQKSLASFAKAIGHLQRAFEDLNGTLPPVDADFRSCG